MVTSGTDVTNVFGFGTGASVIGKNYSLSFVYDIDTYTYDTLPTQHSLWNSTGGVASATLAIGSGSLVMNNVGYGNVL